jgi:hypothetical protein
MQFLNLLAYMLSAYCIFSEKGIAYGILPKNMHGPGPKSTAKLLT